MDWTLPVVIAAFLCALFGLLKLSPVLDELFRAGPEEP